MNRHVPVLAVFFLMFPMMISGTSSQDNRTQVPDVLYVSPEGSTFSTIQDAVDSANVGDMIYIAPGNYNKSVSIFIDGISLIGNLTHGEIRVNAPGEDQAIHISADHIFVRGITAIGGSRSVILINDSRDLTAFDLNVKNEVGKGIIIRESHNIRMEAVCINCSGGCGIGSEANVTGMVIEDFVVTSDGDTDGISIGEESGNCSFKNGSLYLSSSNGSCFNISGAFAVEIRDIIPNYNGTFLVMDGGVVDIFNTHFPERDLRIDSTDTDDRASVFFEREIIVTGTDVFNNTFPLERVDLYATVDDKVVYSTRYYGGSDPLSDGNGSFPRSIAFLSRCHTGTSDMIYGVNRVEVRSSDGINVSDNISLVDANTTDPLKVNLRNYPAKSPVEGVVTFRKGPMDGLPGENVAVLITHPKEIFRETTTNRSGYFSFGDIFRDRGYVLEFRPESGVEQRDNRSGYPIKRIIFDLYGPRFFEIELEYVDHIPGSGPVFGSVAFKNREDSMVYSASVFLMDETGEVIGSTRTDIDGHYDFEEIPFDSNMTVRVLPPENLTGKWHVRSGYLESTSAPFEHDDPEGTEINFLLNYYEYVEPGTYPVIGIIDEQGDPVEGAEVIVTVGNETFISHTNSSGYAEFRQYRGDLFPAGSELSASKIGYDRISWTQGDTVPKMKISAEDDESSEELLIIGSILLVSLMILIGGILIFGEKKRDYEE
jgi:hypothetical protein